MSGIKRVKPNKRGFAGSALVFVASYFLLIAFIFIMLLLMHKAGWVTYIRNNFSRLLILCFVALLLYGIVFYYYYYENREFFAKPKNMLLVYTLILISVILCFLFGKYVNIYLRPVGLLTMTCVFLLRRRQAILLGFVFSILMFAIDVYLAEWTAFNYENGNLFSLIISFVCGTLAAFVAGGVRTRGGVILTGVVISVPTMLIVFLLKLATVQTLGWIQVAASIGFSALGCMMSAVLAMAMLPVFEHAFNRLTIFRLRELTGTNAPILVRLRKEAPGTFNHSLIVAQLSENCAIAINENSELARAAAYYHDVGKLKQPDCFTENQSGYNVHDEIMPELSADIIRSHAKDGYELLKSARLPDVICDVAREHHGTLPIKYFYAKATKISGDDADIKDYSYLGPTPQTKIAAIVMIADAAEATSRVLPDRSPENVERAVRAIIEERMDLDQFAECNITLKELTIIKETLVEALSGVHHHRVEYPAIRFNRERRAVKEDDATEEDE